MGWRSGRQVPAQVEKASLARSCVTDLPATCEWQAAPLAGTPPPGAWCRDASPPCTDRLPYPIRSVLKPPGEACGDDRTDSARLGIRAGDGLDPGREGRAIRLPGAEPRHPAPVAQPQRGELVAARRRRRRKAYWAESCAAERRSRGNRRPATCCTPSHTTIAVPPVFASSHLRRVRRVISIAAMARCSRAIQFLAAKRCPSASVSASSTSTS